MIVNYQLERLWKWHLSGQTAENYSLHQAGLSVLAEFN
jgi:hypothetical protein